MDISIGTSNIQPYGNSNGTQLALDNNNAKTTSSAGDNVRSAKDETVAVSQQQQKPPSPQAIEDLLEQRKELNADQIQKVVERMDEFVNSMNKNVSFRVDEETGRRVITIYEAQTGDVIRQIPEEEMLEVLRRLAVASSGLFVEEAV